MGITKAAILASVAVILLSSIGIACPPARGKSGMMGPRGHAYVSRLRHHYAKRFGLPDAYWGRFNPQSYRKENILAGKSLYENNCGPCHGARGLGNGPAGISLNPPPANLAWSTKRHMASDPYLIWTLSDGGKPIHSDMPAFKGALQKRDLWNIILYIRQL